MADPQGGLIIVDIDGDASDTEGSQLTEGSQESNINVLATAQSPKLIELKGLMDTFRKVLKRESDAGKKLTIKTQADFTEINVKMFLICSDAVAAQLKAEEKIRALERMIADKNDQFNRLESTIKDLSNNFKNDVRAHDNSVKLTGSPKIQDSIAPGSSKLTYKPRDDTPALIIDTVVEGGAKSYRDALVSLAPDLGNPKFSDIIMSRPNRLILKMKDHENLKQFREQLESNNKINKLAQTKISENKKQRLIFFGVPDDYDEKKFRDLIMGLEEVQVKDCEIVKSFGNSRKTSNLLNFIADIDTNAATYLLKATKLIVDYCRIRINKYINIQRCFRCQRFGHTAYKCSYKHACAGCGDNHDTRQCTSKEVLCINCEDGGGNCKSDHRADSKDCPSYKNYKRDTISFKNKND
ncbi:hypothetical protein JTE90_007574 [Oedothorax gibbosus]|uniref:CCHC-type domain-containing protein n=1 Tax=Oedothorax gibbosus TaxID=931172 RepID=A0AAV6TDW7_9ARAC|nr:hypothetical protein JTE90_007574 [Oedothorax gibbosus]